MTKACTARSRLVGRANTLTAELLAHLGEVEARGIHRERACSSLYTYCVYELCMSEDEAQRRCRAARLARQFPVLLEMLAEASIHLTGVLLIGPHLTADNQSELLARVRYRTKREIERIVGELAPASDLPPRVEVLHGEQPTHIEQWEPPTAPARQRALCVHGRTRATLPGTIGAGVSPSKAPCPRWASEREQPGAALPRPQRPGGRTRLRPTVDANPADTTNRSRMSGLILKSRIELSCRALSRRSGVGCLSHEFRQAGSIKRARRWLSWDVLARHLSRVVQAKVLHGNVTERF